MPRRRYYRRYTRVVAPRKKWATNIVSASVYKQVSAQEIGSVASELVRNSSQDSIPTPVIIKTGNFKIQGDCYITTSVAINSSSQLTLYAMYLPEGNSASSGASFATLVSNHPEWIMGWKVVDMNYAGSTSNANSFSFSSRLKRNLNSGDSVALVAVIRNGTVQPLDVTVNYTCQYWSCAN